MFPGGTSLPTVPYPFSIWRLQWGGWYLGNHYIALSPFPGTTRGRGQQPGSLCLVLQTLLNRAHHAHRSGSRKFTFVISKEKGFLYRVDRMRKTTDGLFNLLKKTHFRL